MKTALVLVFLLFGGFAQALAGETLMPWPGLSAFIGHFCEWTGLRQVGPIESVKWTGIRPNPRMNGRIKSQKWLNSVAAEPNYEVRVKLAIGSIPHLYLFEFDSIRRFEFFMPVDPVLGPNFQSKEVTDPQERGRRLAAHRQLAGHLHWPVYGKGWVYRRGSRFLTMYETVPESTPDAIDPFLSFYFTKDGVIYKMRLGM